MSSNMIALCAKKCFETKKTKGTYKKATPRFSRELNDAYQDHKQTCNEWRKAGRPLSADHPAKQAKLISQRRIQKTDGPAGQTSWTNQLDGPAGQTSSFYLKPWPVRIFEDYPFSLYIVAASESDEGLVFLKTGTILGAQLIVLGMLEPVNF